MWRSLAVTLEEGHHLLLFTQHHMITDGWSMVRLVRELAALYKAGGQISSLGKHEYEF